jgi:hypothetical protein
MAARMGASVRALYTTERGLHRGDEEVQSIEAARTVQLNPVSAPVLHRSSLTKH